MKNLRFLSITAILVAILAGAIGIGKASAQTVCSPATAISVPFVKDGVGTFCWQTTSLCYQVNSWHMTALSINGTNYANMFVYSSSIPRLNGGYTITYDGGTTPYAAGHLEITGPYQAGGTGPCDSVPATPTPAGPTATLTRTPTNGPTATRTRTATSGPSLTATRTSTPTIVTVPTATKTLTQSASACSPATTITAPFAKDGAGTFCWRISTLGFINSYNLTNLSVNGVNLTNMWVAAANLPPQIGGYWYISYNATVQYGHFEAQP